MNQNQLRAIVWLRLRLTRNQWRRSKGLGPVLAAAMGALALLLAFVGLVGGALAGWFVLGNANRSVALAVWAGLSVAFVFWWIIGLISELQRAEMIDIPRLLHLPVRLGQIYAVNYLATLVGPSVALFSMTAFGLAVGSALARGPRMLLAFLPFVALVFAISAWTYCFQGWIATQVTNPRRRRMLVMGLTMLVVLAGQVPNFYFNVLGKGGAHGYRAATISQSHESARQARVMNEVELAVELAPPLWPAASAERLTNGEPLFAVLSALALLGIGALGLHRGYRSTLRYYLGDNRSPGAARPAAKARREAPIRGRRLVERAIPGVHPQVSAVATASLRSMLRAPEAGMLVGISVVVSLAIAGGLLFRAHGETPAQFAPLFGFGAMAFSVFALTQFLCNQFGLDRDAVRTFILAPVPRHRLLMGKNLAIAAVAGAPTGVMLLGAVVGLRLPVLEALAGLFQWVAMLVLVTGLGSVLSMVAPYRFSPGSMKAAKLPPAAVLTLLAFQMTFLTVLAPAALGPAAVLVFHLAGWRFGALADLAISALVAAAALGFYALALRPLGRLLNRREALILARVTLDEE